MSNLGFLKSRESVWSGESETQEGGKPFEGCVTELISTIENTRAQFFLGYLRSHSLCIRTDHSTQWRREYTLGTNSFMLPVHVLHMA
jgi:hypothetical protein